MFGRKDKELDEDSGEVTEVENVEWTRAEDAPVTEVSAPGEADPPSPYHPPPTPPVYEPKPPEPSAYRPPSPPAASSSFGESPASVHAVPDAFAERPEVYVGAAFVGGFVLAKIIGAFGDD